MKQFKDIKKPLIRPINNFTYTYAEIEELDDEVDKSVLEKNKNYVYQIYHDLQHNLKEMENFISEYDEAYNSKVHAISKLKTVKAIRIREVNMSGLKRFWIDVCILDMQSGKVITLISPEALTVERKEIKTQIKELHTEYHVNSIYLNYFEKDDNTYLRLLTKEISEKFTIYTSKYNRMTLL